MFDLIDECGKDLSEYGYNVTPLGQYDIVTASLSVSDDQTAEKLGFEKGDYFILNAPRFYENGAECSIKIIQILSDKMHEFIKAHSLRRKDRVLFACLGNPDIAADSLGKEVFDNISIDALSKKNNIFKFCPNIYYSTGIETIDMVEMVIKCMSINYCIIIDSLTTSSISRLGNSFQITTSGMTPGSGVTRFNRPINQKTMGVPCFSVGVPFMIFAEDLDKSSPPDLILSPKDIGENISHAGMIIVRALNEAIK